MTSTTRSTTAFNGGWKILDLLTRVAIPLLVPILVGLFWVILDVRDRVSSLEAIDKERQEMFQRYTEHLLDHPDTRGAFDERIRNNQKSIQNLKERVDRYHP